MFNRKICNTITKLGGLIVLIAFLSGCKKRLQKEPSVVSINVINPVTEEPISGVKYLLKEYEEISKGQTLGNNDLIETENNPIISGETDASGNASFDFYKKRDHDFAYVLTIDYSDMDVPPGDYEIISGGEKYFLEQHEREHYFNFEIVPYVNFVYHVYNKNCQGSNDKMTFRTKYLFTGSSWHSWLPEHLEYKGCVNEVSNVQSRPMDVIVREMIVEREDGTTEQIFDTSRIGVSPIDTVSAYY